MTAATDGSEPHHTDQRGTVLLTGANGALGRVLTEALPMLGWNVRRLAQQLPPDGDGPGVFVGSVTNAALVAEACAGVDAIIHFAGIANPGSTFAAYLDVNLNGTFAVLTEAVAAGVPRVILASSNHATGYTERGDAILGSHVTPRPDSLYGISKVGIEALGSFFADEFGLETVSLRIGSCFETPTSHRMLASWLSYPDLVRLVEASLTSPLSGHHLVWGVSNNTRRWWSLAEGEAIGYFPEDDAEAFAAGLPGIMPAHVGGSAPPGHSGE